MQNIALSQTNIPNKQKLSQSEKTKHIYTQPKTGQLLDHVWGQLDILRAKKRKLHERTSIKESKPKPLMSSYDTKRQNKTESRLL